MSPIVFITLVMMYHGSPVDELFHPLTTFPLTVTKAKKSGTGALQSESGGAFPL